MLFTTILLCITFFISNCYSMIKFPYPAHHNKHPLTQDKILPTPPKFLTKYGNEPNIYATASGPIVNIFNILNNTIKTQLRSFYSSINPKIPYKSHAHTVYHGINNPDNTLFISSDGVTIKIWNPHTNKCEYTLIPKKCIFRLTADHETLFMADYTNKLTMWDIGTHKDTLSIEIREPFCSPYSNAVSSLIVHKKLFYVGLHSGIIILFDPRSQTIIYAWPAHDKKISSLLPYHNDDTFIYSGSGDNSIKLWDLRKLQGCNFKPNRDNQLFSSDQHKQLYTIHKQQTKEVNNFYAINNVIYHPINKNILITSDQQNTLSQWNTTKTEFELLTTTTIDSPIVDNCMVTNNEKTIKEDIAKIYIGTKNGIKNINLMKLT